MTEITDFTDLKLLDVATSTLMKSSWT